MNKKWIAAFAVLPFALPWIHRLEFENARLAIPDLDASGWHATAIVIPVFIGVIYGMLHS